VPTAISGAQLPEMEGRHMQNAGNTCQQAQDSRKHLASKDAGTFAVEIGCHQTVGCNFVAGATFC